MCSYRFVGIGVFLTLCVWGCLEVAAQEEGTVPSRRIIRYDSEIQLHDVDPGIVLPEKKREQVRGSATPTAPGSGLGDARPVTSSPTYLPPPPVPPSDPKRRNWIIPTLEGEHEPRSRPDEEKQQTGWGWLADELSQKRDKETANVDVDTPDWAASQRDISRPPATLGTPGLSMDNLFTSPLQLDSSGREMGGGQRHERSVQNQSVIRDTEAMERAVRAGAADEPYQRDDPYATPNAWGPDPLSPPAWDRTTSFRSQEEDLTAQYGGISGLSQAGAIPSPVLTPTPRTSSLSPSSSVGGMGSGNFDSLSPSFSPSFGGGADRLGGRFESASPAGSGAFATTPWRTDWSGDTGWKSAGQEPVRSPSLSAPTPITPEGLNRGWLAEPAR